MYQSLFEYLGKPAGPELGKRIYAEAKKRRVKVSSRQVNTRKYKGTILTYPVSFLDNYFKDAFSQITSQITTSQHTDLSSLYTTSSYNEIAVPNHEQKTTGYQKKSPLENLY